jgi:hypothetical protein
LCDGCGGLKRRGHGALIVHDLLGDFEHSFEVANRIEHDGAPVGYDVVRIDGIRGGEG